MSGLPVRILGLDGGEQLEVQVLKHHGKEHVGLVVLSDPLIQFKPESRTFLNDTFGSAMNQNIAFSGTPQIIHNGGTSVEWTGSAIQGAWNFADSGKISLTSANDNDEASFAEETPTTIDLSGYTTLTGKINLTAYSGINNTLTIAFDNAGTPVGDSININNYIDTGLIGTEQTFVIPKADMGLTTQLVDGFTIILNRTGGTKPTMIFDDIQLEETGATAIFKASTPVETVFHISSIRLSIVDNISGITTVAGATENATLPGLSYDQILGLAKLNVGIGYQLVQDGKIQSSLTLKQLGDFTAAGFNIIDVISDGTNTCLTLELTFPKPIILKGNGDENSLFFSINDNLSGLVALSAIARGALESD